MALFSTLAAAAAAQDTQISARAKGMGGSYTAFGDDPIAIWQNPAGTATQTTKLALSYQSFITYEFANAGIGSDAENLPGSPQATLNDPQIQPSFLGLVVSLSDKDLNHAFSFGFINPLNLTLVWTDTGGEILESSQQSARFRFGYAVDLTLVKSGKGWLTHIAVGGGIDWGSTTYEDKSPDFPGVTDRESRFGFGVGILATIFSDGEGLSVDIGASYNSKLDFQGNVPRTGGMSRPFIDWPAEWSVGIAVYVQRLKVTAAVQGVLWKDAASSSTAGPGFSSFENTLTASAGVEYALHLTDKVTALVRAGVRRFDAPWDDEALAAFGGDVALSVAVDRWALSIDTDGEVFTMGTVGGGIYWTEEGGKKRGFDFGVEFGGDKVTLAIGYVHEF
jgi:hypothetical protein